MQKIALTGGIGSGKSTVASMFGLLGIPVYVADTRAKQLMSGDRVLKNQIKNLLGADAYHVNGRLNRKFVADKVFNNKSLLASLNNLVHPAVHNDFQRWAQLQTAPYVIEEAAIIFETGAYKRFDKTILVVADESLRIERVMKRDNTRKEEVLLRMARQMNDEEKINLADFIIDNNGTRSLIRQVIKIHRTLLKNKKLRS